MPPEVAELASHAAPRSAKATAGAVGSFFPLVIAVAIVYALIGG